MDFGERRVAEMDKCGVDVAVMGVSPAHEELPKAESIRFAKASNDAVAELCRKYPGRIDGIIFGSDYPYENLKVMTDTWNEISSELTEEEREKFWHGNAERYGLV